VCSLRSATLKIPQFTFDDPTKSRLDAFPLQEVLQIPSGVCIDLRERTPDVVHPDFPGPETVQGGLESFQN